MKGRMEKAVSLILAVCMMLTLLSAPAFAEAGEEDMLYWGIAEAEDLIISSDGSDTDSCTVKGSFSGNEEWDAEDRPWDSYSDSIRSVYIKGTVVPTATCNWFCDFNICGSMDLSGLDTSHVTNMSYMFAGCNGLFTLDLSDFDTRNVTNMRGMFLACNGPTTLDLSGLDTSSVTDMSYMFAYCSRLESLNLSGLNTANVTDMSNMFKSCSLAALDLSSFDTSAVTTMREMFDGCLSLKTVDLSSFRTPNVTDMSGMFNNCQRLLALDVSGFDTKNVTDMSNMFSYCSRLESLDLSGFQTTNVTNMSHMFDNCRYLTALDISNFNTAHVTDMSNMFAWCQHLTALDVSGFDTANVSNMSNMFSRCEGLTALDVSDFDTAGVTNMSGMFDFCGNLETVDVSGFDTASVTDMTDMFAWCKKLTAIDVSGFDTAQVTNMRGMFFLCERLTALDLSSFDMSGVTDAVDMLGQMAKSLTLTLSETVADQMNHMNFSMYDALYLLENGCGSAPVKYEYNYDGWHYTGLTAGIYYTDEETIPSEHRYRESWESDESGHSRVCTNCGERTDEGPHSYSNDQTVCDICGYTRKPSQPETSSGSGSDSGSGSSSGSDSGSTSGSGSGSSSNAGSPEVSHSVAAEQPVEDDPVDVSNTESESWAHIADVKSDDWYYESVKQVYEKGLFYGTSDSTFSPQETMTRGMLVTVLHRLAGTPETLATDQFRDAAAETYYAEAVAWAVENNIAQGYGDGSFGAQECVTREQIAVMLYNYAGNPEPKGTLDSFTDAGQAGKYARTALCWAVEQGIMTGKGGGILDPKGKATRAEVAAMIVRYLTKEEEVTERTI